MGAWIYLPDKHLIHEINATLNVTQEEDCLTIFFPSQRVGSLAPSSQSASPRRICPPRGHHGAHSALHDSLYLQAVPSLPSADALTWFCILLELM